MRPWLRSSFPIHFFDFEAWSPALPVLPGAHPCATIPFQWSDHCLAANGELDHGGFLADGPEDPRRQVAESLLERLGNEGSIVAYHSDYERNRLTELAALFPDGPIDWCPRLANHRPRAHCHQYVYHPDFHGSFSLKKVFPVLVSGPGYEELAIQEGESAALAYQDLRLMPEGAEKMKLREDMLAYCQMDTQAMVDLYWEA